MSASDSGQGQPGDRPAIPRRNAVTEPRPDAGTDPGRAQPYESLYRGPADSPTRVHRTTARHYEPSSAPPGEQPPGDTYHWLYRNDEPVVAASTPVGGADAADPDTAARVAGVGDQAAAGADPDPPGRADPGPAAGDAGDDAPAIRPTGSGEPTENPAPRRRPLIVVSLVLLLVAVLVGGAFFALERRNQTPGAGPAVAVPTAAVPSGEVPSKSVGSGPSASTSAPEPTTTASAEQDGDATAVAVPVRVAAAKASCEARASTDGGGRRVSYQPELTIDGDPSTAWRCDGSGTSQSLTFSFADGTQISELGLINGYTKVDPATSADRYGEYRRITQVRWTFPSGTSFTQELEDGEESVQKLGIATQSADQVQLTVTKSTAPGSKAETRDAVLVAEVSFSGPTS